MAQALHTDENTTFKPLLRCVLRIADLSKTVAYSIACMLISLMVSDMLIGKRGQF